ncbi:MAG: hypothetical protein ABIJ15_03155 [bacterium]
MIEDRILQLIYLAEVNLECCRTIHNFIESKKRHTSAIDYIEFKNHDKTRYLTLSANNHFFESVSIIHTLLHQVNTKNSELSFQLYRETLIYQNCFDNNTQEFLYQIENLWKEFEKENFHKIRNKLVAHKDVKNIGNPETIAVARINLKLIEKLKKILRSMKIETTKYFKDSISNNYLMSAKRGLEKILFNN